MRDIVTKLAAKAPTAAAETPRLFVGEIGWRVGHKVGSEREFCYAMAPGQDYYHRLNDGEIYLLNNEEKLCLACAGRRGLLTLEPKGLREQLASFEFDAAIPLDPIDLGQIPGDTDGNGKEPR
jgi:hypothetical protein